MASRLVSNDLSLSLQVGISVGITWHQQCHPIPAAGDLLLDVVALAVAEMVLESGGGVGALADSRILAVAGKVERAQTHITHHITLLASRLQPYTHLPAKQARQDMQGKTRYHSHGGPVFELSDA